MSAAKPANAPRIVPGKTMRLPQDSGPFPWYERIAAVCILTLYFSLLHIMAALLVCSFLFPYVWMVYAAVVLSVFLPAQTLWPAFNESYVLTLCRKYFNFSYCFETELDTKKRYIFCHFPHGVFPVGPQLASSIAQHLFKDMKVYGVSANAVFKTPLIKHVMSWHGARPATKKNFKELLKNDSCGCVVGGLASMYNIFPDKEVITLKTRRGFVKVAIESGAQLVPVYYFGNTQILDFAPRFLKSISRKLRFSLGFLYGKWGLPIPYQVHLHMVVGTPIEVKQMDAGDEHFAEYVEETHAKFVVALKDLYNKHRVEYGWEGRPLVID